MFAAEIVDLSLQNNCIKNELSIKNKHKKKKIRKKKTNHEWLWKLCAKDTDKIFFSLPFQHLVHYENLLILIHDEKEGT